MALKNTLRTNLTAAMKARDELNLAVTRALLAAVEAKEKGGKTVVELDDTAVLAVFRSEAKKRRDSAAIYTEAGAPERAARESAEADVIETYLPAELTDTELAELVQAAISETGASGLPQMGLVMKAAKAKAPLADGAKLSALVRAALA